jgi:hypothetical protein
MADQSHLDILQQGVEAWNSWRERNPSIKPDLCGEPLSEADLRDADLSGAVLRGAIFLFQEQLEETTGDENTQLPSNLKPPAHWNVKTDEQIEGD